MNAINAINSTNAINSIDQRNRVKMKALTQAVEEKLNPAGTAQPGL
ncbi:MAG: hypothetical protein NTX36_11055 [Proteobacteria bacterium]|nr:hypothetical protein [Pseudomonadota bacterium]